MMSQKEDENKLVPLTNLYNPVESEMVQDLLQKEGIPVLARDEETGGYLKVYAGYSVFGESLYVKEKDYARAQELLHAMQQNSEEALEEAQTEAFDDVALFEQSEAEQQKQQQGEEKKKSAIPVVLILAVAVILVLWKLGL